MILHLLSTLLLPAALASTTIKPLSESESESPTITESTIMHYISTSIFIIYLLFLSVHLVSGNPQPRIGIDAVEKPGPVKPNGSGHHEIVGHPGKLFGWDRGLDPEAPEKNHPYLLAQEFVAAHNWVRKRFNQPLYKWDEKLASYARQYAMQRSDDCKMVHSDGPYGENLFWGKRLHWTASDAVYYWYIENKWFNFNSLKCSAPKDKGCGHFTQIVWRDSVRVGCAVQHCRNRKSGMLVVCEYDPPGNFNNENPLVNNNAKTS